MAKMFGVVCGLLMISALPLGAGERLTMKISPNVAFAPANLVVRTSVEADAANRALELVAESVDFYRSSEIQLDGENAPRTARFVFKGLPPGEYIVSAVLKGSGNEQRASVRQQVNVLDAEGH